MAESRKPAEKQAAAETPPKKDGTRETIESIVIAFIFAFLFRTFEAEAFVIPTGSMAPTLLGRHKDETCPKCGFSFTVGASEELDREGNFLMKRIESAICPNCRFEMNIRQDPVFIGDRILVTKFNPEIGDTDRWDVTVFKFPEDPTTNYIKRLCGLPGETIEIRQGDLYSIRDGKAEILRKLTGDKQRAVLQVVYDDDLPCREMLAAGWPERWAGVADDDGPNAVAGWSEDADGWQTDGESRRYQVEAGDESRWLRYRHFLPTQEDWEDLPNGRLDPEARLVLDFCGYNAMRFEQQFSPPEQGVYWVGDLAVSATIDLQAAQAGGDVTLELVEGSRKYRCTLDPNGGKATLSYVDALDREQRDEAARILSEASIDFAAGDECDIAFANVDNQLWLWIDGDAVEFPTATYEPFAGQVVQLPRVDDLTPAGIAATNVTATVSHLKLSRDVYYRADFVDQRTAELPDMHRSSSKEVGTEGTENRLHDAADDPDVYAELYRNAVPWLRPDAGASNRLTLGDDEFLMLGDNSPRSLDGRLWGNLRGDLHRHAVPRSALVGKALLIFWPHGLRLGNEKDGVAHGWTIPGLDTVFYHMTGRYDANGRPIPTGIAADYPAHGLPFYPNFGRILRRIR
ncbi:MAG: signal peptidase I [Planctomycetota bacterium]|nr:signal peptidase I [Planctomycetota bacterium]